MLMKIKDAELQYFLRKDASDAAEKIEKVTLAHLLQPFLPLPSDEF